MVKLFRSETGEIEPYQAVYFPHTTKNHHALLTQQHWETAISIGLAPQMLRECAIEPVVIQHLRSWYGSCLYMVGLISLNDRRANLYEFDQSKYHECLPIR